MQALEKAVTRRITRVRVLPLHGIPTEWGSIKEATEFILGYAESRQHDPLGKLRATRWLRDSRNFGLAAPDVISRLNAVKIRHLLV